MPLVLTAELKSYADTHKVKFAIGSLATLRKNGVHVLNPTSGEVEQAIEEAIIRGLDTIYIYKGAHFAQESSHKKAA